MIHHSITTKMQCDTITMGHYPTFNYGGVDGVITKHTFPSLDLAMEYVSGLEEQGFTHWIMPTAIYMDGSPSPNGPYILEYPASGKSGSEFVVYNGCITIGETF